MKNPSITAALVLVLLALVVGGLALSSGGDAEEGQAQVLTAGTPVQKASFETLSPHEQRKKGRLEEARRELAQIRKVGKEVAPNVFKIKDDTGDPTYFYGDLIEGVGRNGEPLYLSAQFKRLPAVPLQEPHKVPAKLAPKLQKEPKKALKLGKPKDDGQDGSGGGQGGGTGDAGGGTGGGSGLGGG